ncbi:hypothetical protein ACS0TY_025055 [Phlomoides rotata]
MCAFTASGNAILIGRNITLSFEDIEANFALPIIGPGKRGTLYVAEPLDACSRLTNKIISNPNDTNHPFVLIIRGGCSFEDKVQRVQVAGFKAAIVYDNETGDLVSMAGTPFYVWIHAVFVSKVSGDTLAKYVGAVDMELWITPSYENPLWSIIVISFISLLAMSVVLDSCFFVRRHQIRRERPSAPHVREFHGISSRLVKAMPTLIFTVVLEDYCTSQTCAICLEDYNAGEKLRVLPCHHKLCLEDYNVGEKLRVLPCHHKFHATCINTWLTSWRTFCPICKRDASTDQPAATESTPLLSSSSATTLQIGPSSYRSPSISSPQSISSILHDQHSLWSESLINQPYPQDIESSGNSSPS